MPIKIALPKGRLLSETAVLLQEAGWGLDGYSAEARRYLPESQRFPDLRAKVFHEKDIPVQVAIGNYDLGICGLDWIEELLVKYPSSTLIKVTDLGYARTALYIAASDTTASAELKADEKVVRIASEYPNLAESFALKSRLLRFNIFPVWGAAEVYPPENAELVLLAGGACPPSLRPARRPSQTPAGGDYGRQTGQELFNGNLVAVSKVLDSSAFLIANKDSWEIKDLSAVLTSIYSGLRPSAPASLESLTGRQRKKKVSSQEKPGVIRLALPDGHQQKPTLELLSRAGIKIRDYPSATGNRRPAIDLSGVTVKVIRPQDMPLQVANCNFDLAITGRDWLREHLYKFPSSPVRELVDLKYGRVKIVAVVSGELPAGDVSALRQFNTRRQSLLRIASEYINIADKFAVENRLGMYRVVPTWGATEAFLPDDADLLIENTQTGRTLARHNLKIIDTLFESTACLISNINILNSEKDKKIESIADILRRVVEGNT